MLVDSSVWIDYFNGRRTAETDYLDRRLGEHPIILGDLILVEVLRGFRSVKDRKTAEKILGVLPFVTLGGKEVAQEAVKIHVVLRDNGITVHSTIDLCIGAFCIINKVKLLHSDRDYSQIARHCGLQVWES